MRALMRGERIAQGMPTTVGELKFYSEARMQAFREALEATVLAWPGVARKEMMGSCVYFRGRKFFAFLVTGGIVITKLSDADRAMLARRPGSKPFEMSGRTSSKWIQLPLRKPQDLQPLLSFVRESYEAASGR